MPAVRIRIDHRRPFAPFSGLYTCEFCGRFGIARRVRVRMNAATQLTDYRVPTLCAKCWSEFKDLAYEWKIVQSCKMLIHKLLW